jgi:hypothetical protein
MIDYYKINEEIEESFPINGKGNKDLLLLIYEDESEFLVAKLQEIMQAIKYDLQDDCIYLFSAGKRKITGSWINTLGAKNIIIFNEDNKSESFNLPVTTYVPAILESKQIVTVELLSEILNDQNKKFKFWQLLQKMFLK